MRGRGLIVYGLAGTLTLPVPAAGWGLTTHRWVNEAAVEAVPVPLRSFVRGRRETLSDLAVEPDTIRRERDGRREAIRHFVHLERYGEPPFADLPGRREQAEARFGRDTMDRSGVLPWTILRLYRELERAFRRGDTAGAVRRAGLVGHYLADAFMPLHVTRNHDGQRTGNDGIHHRLEDLVDERLGGLRPALQRKIRRVGPTPSFTEKDLFSILRESHERVAVVLRADRRARMAGEPGTEAYADALAGEVRPLLEDRLPAAATSLAILWSSAWVAAGRPDFETDSPVSLRDGSWTPRRFRLRDVHLDWSLRSTLPFRPFVVRCTRTGLPAILERSQGT